MAMAMRTHLAVAGVHGRSNERRGWGCNRRNGLEQGGVGQNRRSVHRTSRKHMRVPILVAAIFGSLAAATSVEKGSEWYKQNAELFLEIETAEQYHQAIEETEKDTVLVVDFYASWCFACQNFYPHLCEAARAAKENERKAVFLKVNVDANRKLAKEQGVLALPLVQIWRAGRGKVTQFNPSPKKKSTFFNNLELIFSKDPSTIFDLKPWGALEVAKDQTQPQPNAGDLQAEKDKKKQEADEMAEKMKALRERLSMVADQGKGASTVPSRPLSAVKQEFLANYPDYGYKGKIDKLYKDEIGSRMGETEHYMDYTGSSLYCNSQLKLAFEDLASHVFGNPHSENPSSSLASERIEEAREMILSFFDASPSDYQVVFTKSATDALKIVGETFPWSADSEFRYLRENHNSVLGIRQYAVKNNATFRSMLEPQVESWLESNEGKEPDIMGPAGPYKLFAFPAEDNFAGVKYPLDWVKKIKALPTSNGGSRRWYVLLDAAAYAPTQPLSLRKVPADFVSMSFYKMFGFPTGLGALLIRNDAVDILQKVFWGGGSVALATADDDFHVLKCKPTEALEDGTVAFLDIAVLKYGFQMIEKLGGIHSIQKHVEALTRYMYTRLHGLHHSNGLPLVVIYGKHHLVNHAEVQGGVFNFNVLRKTGTAVSYLDVQRKSAKQGIHLRTGAECNPGAAYGYLGIDTKEIEDLAGKKEGCHDDVDYLIVQRPLDSNSLTCGAAEDPSYSDEDPALLTSKEIIPAIDKSKLELGHAAEVAMHWVKVPLGSVRVSLGYMSTFEDVDALVTFLEDTYKDS